MSETNTKQVKAEVTALKVTKDTKGNKKERIFAGLRAFKAAGFELPDMTQDTRVKISQASNSCVGATSYYISHVNTGKTDLTTGKDIAPKEEPTK